MRYFFLPILMLLVQPLFSKKMQTEWTGTASFYANKFNGRKTASGEIFSNKAMTAANNFLPLGTRVKVTNLKNHKSVIVKINDRLHNKNKRLIDLTYAAAHKLGFVSQGTCKVKMEIIHGKQAKMEEPEEISIQKDNKD
jgi:rare lipoprotein A